jgi:tetratricopeptide (TPR) repeat protein
MGWIPLTIWFLLPSGHGWMERLDTWAFHAYLRGEYAAAEQVWAVVAEYHRGKSGKCDEYAGTLNMLAQAQAAGGKQRDAEYNMRLACRLLESTWGDGKGKTPAAVINLIRFLTKTGRFREAEELAAAHLRNTVRLWPDDPEQHADVLLLFVQLYLDSGRLSDAEKCGRRAIELYGNERVFETMIAAVATEMASVYIQLGKKKDAEKMLELAKRSRVYRDSLMFAWADYYLKFDQPKMVLFVIEGRHQALKKDDRKASKHYVALLNERLGEAAVRLGDTTTGKKLLLSSLDNYEKELGSTHPRLVRTLETYARLFPDEAEPYHARAKKVRDQMRENEPKGLDAAIGKLP